MRPHEEHSNLNEDYSSDDSIEADDENGMCFHRVCELICVKFLIVLIMCTLYAMH